MNPRFQRMLGYTEDEFRNLTVFEFTHEDDRAETRRFFSGIIAGPQTSYRLEKRYRRKDGGTIWADVSASMVLATDTTPAFLAVMAVDITDRRRAEAALRASEERWRRMFETSAAGMATARLDGVFTAANPALQRMLDRTEDEIVGGTAMEITHQDERAETANVVAKFRNGLLQEYHVEKRYLKSDGSPVWLNITTTLVPATETAVSFLQAIYINITDRKRAEAALRASEQRWRTVFETAAVGITTVGANGRYMSANASFQRLTGYTEDELRGLTPFDITHEDDRDLLRTFPQSPTEPASAAGYEVEKRYRRKDGQVAWAYLNSFTIPASESIPGFFAAIVVDITGRKRTEEALQQAQADLARLNRVMLMGELTASIAHEVNQPIAATVANAGAGLRWLAARPPNLEEARLTLARIVRDGNRAGEVIDRVRALARKVPPRRDRLDLGEVIREVIALTQAELQRNEVRLQTRIADGLPLVPGDRVQLQQVIINLVVNAVEAMSEVGDRPRELTIVAGKGNSNELFVEVQDIGSGLDQANLDRLFHSFYTTKCLNLNRSGCIIS